MPVGRTVGERRGDGVFTRPHFFEGGSVRELKGFADLTRRRLGSSPNEAGRGDRGADRLLPFADFFCYYSLLLGIQLGGGCNEDYVAVCLDAP